jgi:hypothetical protein
MCCRHDGSEDYMHNTALSESAKANLASKLTGFFEWMMLNYNSTLLDVMESVKDTVCV